MAAIFAFKCTSCGDVHEGSPSFAFDAPSQYASLSDEEKTRMAYLDADVCRITHGEGTDYFIRTVLEIPIHGIEEPFVWGVWVSLSEKSLKRYVEIAEDPPDGEGYFGWLCNGLPVYPETLNLATDVIPQKNGLRPLVRLHRGEQSSHPLVIDQQQGITVARAQEIAELAMHGIGG